MKTPTLLLENQVLKDPFAQFGQWYADYHSTSPLEPTAMTLATADAQGQPSVRTVLLKGWSEEGFVFFTNYAGRKGREMEVNPRVELLFYWPPLARQVRVSGNVEKVSEAESDEYFTSRIRISQIGAWASEQSSRIGSRSELEAEFLKFEKKFADAQVPRPPHWGGYRVIPKSFEFWQGQEGRLHDRLVFEKKGSGWEISRLAP